MSHSIRRVHYGSLPLEKEYSVIVLTPCKLTNYRHDATNPNSLSNNNVVQNNITQDSKGNLWFSTSGSGLDLYRPATNDFENFDKERNGLASDCIYETQESPSSGKLLLITNEVLHL